MRVGYLNYNLAYKGRETHPKPKAVIHRSGGHRRWYRGGAQAKCGAGSLTEGQWSVAGLPENWNPDDRPVYTPEEQALRFIQGVKEIPEWAYEGKLCRRCFPEAHESKVCDMGHRHYVRKKAA